MNTIATLHSTLKKADGDLQSAMSKLEQQQQAILELQQEVAESKEDLANKTKELEELKLCNKRKMVDYWSLREHYEDVLSMRDISLANIEEIPSLLQTISDELILKSMNLQRRCEDKFNLAVRSGLWVNQIEGGIDYLLNAVKILPNEKIFSLHHSNENRRKIASTTSNRRRRKIH